MKINSFEDIVAWQKAEKLVLACYKEFRSLRDFSFRDQICRAAVSIMNNIAEGYERAGNKEFRKFLYIAKGSASEVRSMLYLALELNYIPKDRFNDLQEQTMVISKMLSNFIKTL
jgi:four helix bundle protein